jgi:hypothetical protein
MIGEAAGVLRQDEVLEALKKGWAAIAARLASAIVEEMRAVFQLSGETTGLGQHLPLARHRG